MGKYMKKARGVGGAMEITTQGQLGVRTRARAQAIERIKELITSNSGNNNVSSSTSTKSFVPTQISYLELRNRRLEKTVGCTSNKSPSAQKSTSADECRRLSDLTNSDILADDSSSRLALSAEEARRTGRQTKHGACDENRGIIYHFYGDNDVEESSLHGCVRSLQQWGTRGRAPPSVAHSRSNSRSNSVTPPSVAHSRSNSRSNSVTRELPPPTCELPPCGILTRNQRKMEKQFSETIACTNRVADIDVELDVFRPANVCSSSNPNSSCLARNVNVEVSFGEKPLDEGWFARDGLTQDGTPVSHSREVNTPSFSVRLSPELTACNDQAAPSNVASPLDMEIEDFFLQAELQGQRRFMEQYNFDPVKDIPLPGRYDWVSL